ncbi:hypothetical protein RB601_001484 [Gaeumannomyces tritici]
MSHPQAPPVSGSGPPPAGGWSAGTPPAPYQQPPPQGQGQWQQPPQQQPSPYQPYNQQPQPQPAPHAYGQPYQHQPPALGHTPSPLGAQTPYGQPPAGSPRQPPTGAPAATPPGPGGAPHSAGFAPGVGGPANGPPPQGYVAQGYPGAVPQQGGLMGQVNQAFVSGMPYIQTFGSKLTGKFNRITGHASAYQQPPAPGMYGQPGGYGQPAYGHPQQHQQQPGQIPMQQTQPPPHQQQQQSPSPHQQQQQQQQQSPPPYQQQQQPGPHSQPVQSPPPHQQQQPGSYSQPVQSAPPHQQQPIPYNQAPSPYPPTQPTASAPAVSPPPASTPAADPLMPSMSALSLGASAAASTPPPYSPYAPVPAPTTPPAPVTTLPRAASQTWYLVDPASQQPTPEFRAVAALMFDSLNAQGSQQGFVDASKILGAWQANGLDAQWVDLFAYDNYHSFSLMWSLSEIPHVLIPRTPSLVPRAASLGSTPSGPAATTPSAPLTIPADPGSGKFNNALPPAYVPALTVGGYTHSLFLDFFDDPASLPNLVRKQVGIAGYSDHRLRNHTLPDLDAYDASVPADLQSRAKSVRAAAVERAMAEVAKRRSGAPTAPYVS